MKRTNVPALPLLALPLASVTEGQSTVLKVTVEYIDVRLHSRPCDAFSKSVVSSQGRQSHHSSLSLSLCKVGFVLHTRTGHN